MNSNYTDLQKQRQDNFRLQSNRLQEVYLYFLSILYDFQAFAFDLCTLAITRLNFDNLFNKTACSVVVAFSAN